MEAVKSPSFEKEARVLMASRARYSTSIPTELDIKITKNHGLHKKQVGD